MVALGGDDDALVEQGFEVDEGAIKLAVFLAELAGFEDLLDGGEEAVGVGEHDGVELLSLLLGDGPALEGFEVEADGRDRGLKFVGDGVEEGVLTLVAADLAEEEDGVEDDAGDEDGEADNAEDEEGGAALVKDDPADVKGDGDTDEEGAEGDEEGDGSATTGEVHEREGGTLPAYNLCGRASGRTTCGRGGMATWVSGFEDR